MSAAPDPRGLYERQSAVRGDMAGAHFRWYAPRRRLEDTVRLAARAPAARVLEIGCGDAVLLEAVTRALPGRPVLVAGVDVSSGRLVRARERVEGRWAASVAEALPLAPATFDLVLCCEVLEHLRAPRAALDEIARVLAPGGRTVLSVPVVGWSRWCEAKLTGRVRFLDEEEHLREYCARPLPRCETLAALRGAIAEAGLVIASARGIYGWPHRGERAWHTLLSNPPLAAPARALDRALGAGPLREWARWWLIEARPR